jgi:tetratricopeptide (TPR) repeat protein
MKKHSVEDDNFVDLFNSIFVFSQEEVDSFFNVGALLYESAQYESASKFFLYTCIANPFTSRYLAAYAKCIKMMKDFKLAAPIFQLAFFLDRNSPEYAVHAAECLLLSGDQLKAKEFLEIATIDPLLVKNHLGIHQKASAWLDAITLSQNNKK